MRKGETIGPRYRAALGSGVVRDFRIVEEVSRSLSKGAKEGADKF